jgi:hypothetical protein
MDEHYSNSIPLCIEQFLIFPILCFSNSGLIDDDLSVTNFMASSTTAAFVNK